MEKSSNANSYEQQKTRGLLRKWEIIQKRGGKCEICGYNENLSAIEFHHRNPEEKEFSIDMRSFSNTKLETLQLELNKCDMICANCHREYHNPSLSFKNIPNLLLNIDKTTFNNPSGDICPVCNNRFPKMKGKIYCSSECRIKDKHYPTKEEVNEQYQIFKNWEKVAQHFNLTRKIIQGIRNRN